MLAASLLDSVRRRQNIPNSQDLFSDADLLAFADEEFRSHVMPWIIKAREEHATTSKDIQLVANQANYRLPARALGLKIRDVQLVDSVGNVRSLPRLWEEDRRNDGGLVGFYLRSDVIELSPVPTSASESLRVHYYRQPSQLAGLTSVAVIASIDTGNSQVTVSSLPSTISSGVSVDLIQQASPFQSIADDVSVTGASGLTLTLSSIPTGLVAGDFLCLAKTTPAIQLPPDLSQLVVQAVVVRVFESLGKFDSAKFAQEKLMEAKALLADVISPRVDGEPKKFRASGLSRFVRK